MEAEEAGGSPLPELRRLAAASVALLTTPPAKLKDKNFCTVLNTEEDDSITDIGGNFSELCTREEQRFAHLLTQAQILQFYFALQEARQQAEQIQKTAAHTAERPTESEPGGITTREAIAAAIELFKAQAAEDISLCKEQGEIAADNFPANLEAAADNVERNLVTCPAASKITGTQEEQEDITLLSDTEVEMWKWEALSADSEAPTDTEGQEFRSRRGGVTSADKTGKQQDYDGEEGSTVAKQERVATEYAGFSGQRRGSVRGQRSGASVVEPVARGTSESAANVVAEVELPTASIRSGRLSHAVSVVGGLETVSVTEKRHTAIGASSVPELVQRTDLIGRDTKRSSEGTPTVHAEAAERQSLFTLSAGGIRRRRGRIEENLKDRSAETKPTRESAVEKEDVTGQLLGLAQEMKVEATRYGEVLQRDNERLQRTGEAQQQYMDDTEASARQTKSFIKGTGFGFLYTMILLIIACVLFVFMLSFILFVRG